MSRVLCCSTSKPASRRWSAQSVQQPQCGSWYISTTGPACEGVPGIRAKARIAALPARAENRVVFLALPFADRIFMSAAPENNPCGNRDKPLLACQYLMRKRGGYVALL